MSNRRVARARPTDRRTVERTERVSNNVVRNVVETPIGTPVQQMWQVLRVHEDRIKQLSSVVEKVLVRLDESNIVENSIKVNTEIATMQSTVSKLQEQISSMEKENSILKKSLEDASKSEQEAI